MLGSLNIIMLHCCFPSDAHMTNYVGGPDAVIGIELACIAEHCKDEAMEELRDRWATWIRTCGPRMSRGVGRPKTASCHPMQGKIKAPADGGAARTDWEARTKWDSN